MTMSVSPLPPVLPTARIPVPFQPPTLSVLLIILPLSVRMDVYSQTLVSQAPLELPTLVPHSVLTRLKGLLVLPTMRQFYALEAVSTAMLVRQRQQDSPTVHQLRLRHPWIAQQSLEKSPVLSSSLQLRVMEDANTIILAWRKRRVLPTVKVLVLCPTPPCPVRKSLRPWPVAARHGVSTTTFVLPRLQDSKSQTVSVTVLPIRPAILSAPLNMTQSFVVVASTGKVFGPAAALVRCRPTLYSLL